MPDQITVAVPTLGVGGLDAERSGHFGHCETFTLIDTDGDTIGEVRVIENPPHVEGGCLAPVNLLASHNVNAILVAGMGARPLAGFTSVGIDVYFENATPKVVDAVKLLLAGEVQVMDDRFTCGGH